MGASRRGRGGVDGRVRAVGGRVGRVVGGGGVGVVVAMTTVGVARLGRDGVYAGVRARVLTVTRGGCELFFIILITVKPVKT